MNQPIGEDTGDECAMKDCLLSPSVEVWLILRSRHAPRVSAPAFTGVRLCGGHGLEVKRFDDFVDDEQLETIARGFSAMGKERPDRGLCTVECRPIPKVLLP